MAKKYRFRKPVRSVTVRAPRGVKVHVRRKKHNPVILQVGRKEVSLGYYKGKKEKKDVD
jgi:hypothetical protein